MLEIIRIDSEVPATATILGLHGRGGTPQDLAGLARTLSRSARWVLPAAPISAGFGFTWYQRPYTDLSPANRDEFGRARRLLTELIKNIRSEKPDLPLIVLGFSQGGVLALDLAVRGPEPAAAAVVLSGGLYEPAVLKHQLAPSARAASVFWGHGAHDPILPIDEARSQARLLAELGINLDFREYPVDHRVAAEEIADVRTFIERLAP